jgi:osmotically-inducible protein OsmY
MIISKIIKSSNYTLETINKNIYIFGIAMDSDEKNEVLKEANKIYSVEKIIPTIYLVSELSRNKN